MDNTTEQNLAIAYEMIESERLNDAVALLEPIVAQEPNNVDAWWLYAYAVGDPVKARAALTNVLRLDPNYPGAAELSKSLDEKYPIQTAASPIKSLPRPAATVPVVPETLPDLPEDEDHDVSDLFNDEFLDDEEKEPVEVAPTTSRRQRRRIPLPLIAALAILAIVVAVIIINPFGGRTPTQPTATAAIQAAANTPTGEIGLTEEATLVPATETPEIVVSPPEEATTAAPSDTPTEASTPTTEATNASTATDQPPTTEPTDIPVETEVIEATSSSTETIDFASLAGALSDHRISAENDIAIITTSLGDTLVVTVCGDRSSLTPIMDVLAKQGSGAANSIQGIGVRIGDCALPSTMRLIGVSVGDAAAYANGSITLIEFQRQWKPIE